MRKPRRRRVPGPPAYAMIEDHPFYGKAWRSMFTSRIWWLHPTKGWRSSNRGR